MPDKLVAQVMPYINAAGDFATMAELRFIVMLCMQQVSVSGPREMWEQVTTQLFPV